MGRSQSKIFSSLGLAKSQESRDSAGRAFFTVRSGSLDSISMALSLTTQQSGPTRSCSLDDLHLQNESSRVRVQDGRRYALLETSSITSSRTTDAEQRGSECTKSLPVAVDRNAQCSSPRVSRRAENSRDPDGFSDNFVTADDEEGDGGINPRKSEARHGPSSGDSSSPPNLPQSGTDVVGKPSLRKTQVAKEKKSPTSFPEIPVGLLKLSPDELNELVTFTAATFQQSLKEKLVYTHQKLLGSTESNRGRDSPPAPSTAKHVRISERGHHHHARQIAERGGCLECRQVRNKRRTRRERPTSMPPIYMRESEDKPHITITTEDDLGSLHPSQMRARSKNPEEHQNTGMESTQTLPDCSHECSRRAYESRPPHRKCRCQCNSRGKRKRASRMSGCDTDTTRDCHVDTSIDDNCPGLPENRIRPRQHRYHQHHSHRHSICERCLETLGDEKHVHREKHRHCSPDKEGDTISRDEDGTSFLTLEQLKTAGLLMKRSSGYGSGGSTGEPSSLRHSESFNQSRSHKPRAKPVRQGSFRLDDVPTQSIQVSNLQELIYPVRSRTGRDSPATDMAVANLDLNSSEMLVPIRDRTGDRISGTIMERNLESHQKQSSDTTLNNNPHTLDFADGSTVAQTYLHKHHHFHHIIHHSKS